MIKESRTNEWPTKFSWLEEEACAVDLGSQTYIVTLWTILFYPIQNCCGNLYGDFELQGSTVKKAKGWKWTNFREVLRETPAILRRMEKEKKHKR